MRNKLIIILLVCLTSLLFVSQLKCFSYEPHNYGEVWNSWSESLRATYLEGFRMGLLEALIAYNYYITESPGSALPEIVSKETIILPEEMLVIKDIMTDLYKDPANTFIGFNRMIYLARDKLKGIDIEEDLRKMREKYFALKELIGKDSNN